MMAMATANRRNMKLNELWLDAKTHRNLRDLCGSVIAALWALPKECPVIWSEITELVIERRFGRCRNQFPSGQMTVSDYWRASARLMKDESKKATEKGFSKQVPPSPTLSTSEFSAIAARSYDAVLHLSSLCSGRSKALNHASTWQWPTPRMRMMRMNLILKVPSGEECDF